jgi:hypothetical protein
MADVDFVSETRGGCARGPGTMRQCQTSQRRAHYLIEYCLMSNDQLLGCSLPVSGSGTRNSLVHPVR